MLKNKIIICFVLLALIAPVKAENIEEQPNMLPTQVVQNDTQQTSFRQPTSKKKIAKKFLLAMSGVAISSLLLFLILSLYNKARSVLLSPKDGNSVGKENDMSLHTPETLDDAVKTFIEKTNWD